MTDRASTIATFLRLSRNAEKGELARAIVGRWPDVTGDELQRAIDMATPQPDRGRLTQALEPPTKQIRGSQ